MDTTNIANTNSYNELIEILRIFNWPIVFLISILLIRKPIIDLMNRITKVGHGSTTIEAQQQQGAEKQIKRKISNVDKSLGLFKEETIELFRAHVIQESDYESLVTESLKIERLLNYSIAVYIIKHFESIYSSIFGSQLMVLQQLNTFAHEDIESLRRYYEYAQTQNPKFFEGYTYESYIGFLFDFNLIVKENERIGITILGVDFLKYLTETNKNTNKAY